MKIAVALRQVASSESTLRPSEDGSWIDESRVRYVVNEPDAYALQAAIELKEEHSGEVLVITAGPERASDAILEALAKGADRAIHILTPEKIQLDCWVTAQLVAKALEEEHPDLLLTGLQSEDLGYGQTGVLLAELLGLPHVTLACGLRLADAGELVVKRELEGGWYQEVRVRLPAVVTVQSGITNLRYATLLGIRRARSKRVDRIEVSQLAIPLQNILSISQVSYPERSKKTIMFEGPADEIARQLVKVLRDERRLI